MQHHLPQERLIEQLSRNSVPYHDPIAKIHWDRLSLEQYWLPPEAISLHGVPAFMSRPEADRIRLSQYEFLNFIEAGLWLEGMFMERIARSLGHKQQNRTVLKYRLHELREESGHSLMFLELMDRSGLSIPHCYHPRVLLARLFGRYAPLESLAFWMAVVFGEEIPDRLNRYIRRHGNDVCPTIVQMSTIHIVDEARHIIYARELAQARLDSLRGWERTLLRPVLRRLFQQFVSVFYYPSAAVYELAGLTPGEWWLAHARSNETHRQFIAQCINPTLQLFRQHGFALDLDWRPPR